MILSLVFNSIVFFVAEINFVVVPKYLWFATQQQLANIA